MQIRLLSILMMGVLLTGTVIAETPEERDARMAWWREARFGMFVHWGLYSGLAGTWKEKAVGTRGGMEWIQNSVGADTWDYAREAVPRFRPAPEFADAWAQLAREAGCKYVVVTSKHHEGFCLFDSSVTNYDAYDLFGRDLLGEIVEAVRAEELRIGFYHSVIDWHHPQYDYDLADQLPHPLHGRPSPNGPRDHEIYLDYLHHQAEEIMSKYGPIDVIWWDYSKEGNEGAFWRADELMSMVRRKNPEVISNNRLYHIPHIERDDSVGRLYDWKPEQGDFTTPEQTVPSTGVPGVDWEVCMTMNTTWGYSEHDTAWKAPETLLQTLIDIVSKGGNFLLNIGPKADGSIPPESVEAMRYLGRWMRVNGEAIYGTTASPFERPEWGRCTQKGDRLYLHLFEAPADGKLILPLALNEVESASVLASGAVLEMRAVDGGVEVSLPESLPSPIPVVVLNRRAE